MTNKARQKGSRWEVELLDELKHIYGEQVTRTPYKQSCDFANTGTVHIEAKAWREPRFMTWIHNMRRAFPDTVQWAICWTGDRRRLEDAPVMVVDLNFGLALLARWNTTMTAVQDAS
jgi:hypothetical protein